MSILRIVGSAEYNAGVMPSWISIETNDSLAAIMATGYLNNTGDLWNIAYNNSLLALVMASDLTTSVWLGVNIDNSSNISLVKLSTIP